MRCGSRRLIRLNWFRSFQFTRLSCRRAPRRALSYEKPARKREEEEQLLRDFVATVPACGVPVESKIVDTTTGFAACDFTQSIGAELLVVPAPEHVEGAVPSMMDWALQVTPCSLWIVRAGKLDEIGRAHV